MRHCGAMRQRKVHGHGLLVLLVLVLLLLLRVVLVLVGPDRDVAWEEGFRRDDRDRNCAEASAEAHTEASADASAHRGG